MTKCLVHESPILVLPSLAVKAGLNEAIILQQFHYWISSSRHEHEGRKWVYNTYEQWQKQFPFWSISTIRRTIAKLEKDGWIESRNYNKSKLDNTKWYSICYEKLSEVEGIDVEPDHELNQTEQLDESNRTDDLVNMDKPLPESTSENPAENSKQVEDAAQAADPLHFFEVNGFGYPGHYIREKITHWCTDLSKELVVEAMKMALERGVKNWKYAECILINWVDQDIQSLEDVQVLQKKHRESKKQRVPQRKQNKVRVEKIPEWLEKKEEYKQEEKDPILIEKKRKMIEIQQKYQGKENQR
ncbi:DnaD domain-containing protein [Falsibacillus pallidus]|uniref:DnaD/phage-associated family protein n=1 Tax=Falsibacillus pallidus TaxID=493781 RepID=A0A370GPJ8_9BACI|nr:DnaD domain protein [Falsibacillus pallidus]RDI45655.1 DnaD/phage-associated family protein [Falsibacillus pallidus]